MQAVMLQDYVEQSRYTSDYCGVCGKGDDSLFSHGVYDEGEQIPKSANDTYTELIEVICKSHITRDSLNCLFAIFAVGIVDYISHEVSAVVVAD